MARFLRHLNFFQFIRREDFLEMKMFEQKFLVGALKVEKLIH